MRMMLLLSFDDALGQVVYVSRPELVWRNIAGMIPFLALETTRPLDLRQDFSAAGIIAKSHEASFTTYVARVLCRAALADDAPGDDRARLAGNRRCFRHRRRLR